MNRLHSSINPFTLMMDPQSVFDAMERSERLKRLQSRVCRPLDKPLLGPVRPELSAYDDMIDAEPCSDED
ncbi:MULTISPECIES: hypothetical protein [Caldimonas]|jgi:hypothetical protein|uniref:hypothetical protein n=1 Tax=Caldimonas TaxID=196013 RepID=UPI0003775810|nr:MULTISPECIES: hypothetical protein [Caldimonas]MCX7659057.1 hypothetical protein [Caldimonas manganoxidans]GIX25190.1 MAG: hypothetical protein KatS3mg122_2421 [Caldimonas sp.]